MSSPDTSSYLKQWAEMRYIMERANAWNKYDSKKKAEVFDLRNSTDSSSQNVRQKENV